MGLPLDNPKSKTGGEQRRTAQKLKSEGAPATGREKLWGGRFGGRTAGSVEAFTASIETDWRLYRHDILGSIAHAEMLGRQGIVSRREAKRIIAGLKAIQNEIERGQLQFSAKDEDIHMNIERRLIEKIGSAGEKLHTARSRNDQVALDMRLYLREEEKTVLALIGALERELARAARRFLGIVMPGYTHLQRAQPVLLSHHLLAYVEMLERDRERFEQSRARLNVLPLGSGALAGTSLPIDRAYVARRLGFASVSKNSMDAVSDRDFVLDFLSAAAILFMHLSRLAEEMVLWSSAEFGFIELPDEYCTGSSMMPQKKNPDVPELIRGKAGRIYGHLMTVLALMKGLPLTYNRDLQEDKPPLFDTVDTVKSSLGLMAELVGALKVKKEAMSAAARDGLMNATDLADYLVGRGVPFRSAHEIVGRIVRYCAERGRRIEDLALAELRKFSPRIDSDVYKYLELESVIERRRAPGGTATANVRKRLAELGV
ncbi:MAG TPA: argininosuccinate lyase [Candidatus Acidoferrales bacterium]|nr:argininosuccinate lyase [Candidatus Acidoferrales bacterium]